MPLSRSRATLLIVLPVLALALGALWLFYAKTSPPLTARLLPESDAIVFFNLGPVRSVTGLGRNSVPHDPDYQHFVDATGIDFERDLDQAAFALERTADPLGPNGPVAYSEVFEGHFNAQRLASYLHSVATGEEHYAGHTLFLIPSQGRTVRVALLGGDRVAVSNTGTPEQIHSILDHARSAFWLPWTGPSLLGAHFRDVPLLSLAWGIGEIGLPFTEGGHLTLFGLSLPFRTDATFIASLRWTGALQLRAEEIAPGEAAAAASAASLAELLKVARFASQALPERDRDLRAALDGAEVGHQGDRAILTASLPTAALHALLAPPPPVVAGPRLR
jgi:hypothetical protein